MIKPFRNKIIFNALFAVISVAVIVAAIGFMDEGTRESVKNVLESKSGLMVFGFGYLFAMAISETVSTAFEYLAAKKVMKQLTAMMGQGQEKTL